MVVDKAKKETMIIDVAIQGDTRVCDKKKKDVRVVEEDTGNRHENAEFGFRIKEELQEMKTKNAEKHVRNS